jgi:hypothetical protein
MNRWLTLMVAPVLLIAVGCAKAPTEKIVAAEKAVAEAKDAGADKYAAEDFAKLQSMLDTAKKEATEQDAKFALMRDYGKAEQLLGATQADAGRVTTETAKKKEEAKVAAVQAHQAAEEAVKKAQDLVAQAPVGKDRAALEAIKADADGLTASLGAVKAALDGGDYQDAQSKAKAIQDKAQAVAKEIEDALAKVAVAKGAKGKK